MNLYNTKSYVFAFAAAALLSSASGVGAATTLWQFQDATMSGGTSLAGEFSTDFATGNLTAWDVTVQGGPFSGYFFSNTIANYVVAGGPQNYEVANFGGSFISWTFNESLASKLSTVNLSHTEFFCQACGNYDVSGMSGFASVVPEPPVWTIMLLGIGGLGAVMHSARGRQAARAAYQA